MTDNAALVEVFGDEYRALTIPQRNALEMDIEEMVRVEGFSCQLRAAQELARRIRPASLLDYATTIVQTYLGGAFDDVDLTANDALVADMRAWLADCEWEDVDADDIASMPANQIVKAVRRFYDGGLAGFIADAAA